MHSTGSFIHSYKSTTHPCLRFEIISRHALSLHSLHAHSHWSRLRGTRAFRPGRGLAKGIRAARKKWYQRWMDGHEVIEQIGRGTFGAAFLVLHKMRIKVGVGRRELSPTSQGKG
ncbi:hypothetical protein OIU85_008795 [Salix viminalis]|uniref:Protein kinase domain-containing protein n=1 Tax=Salix viminalis TaxID=40686 RepID=A0A9Q0SIH2_SALVM|nr:hypothetical protein OIU85_008795 [Salix viminalis]